MQVTIPQMISGVVSFFIAMIGIAVISPFISLVTDLTWKSQMTYYSTLILIYLIIIFIVYIIVYGTITGKKPNIMGGQDQQQDGYRYGQGQQGI